MKRLISIFLTLLLLAACGTGGQAPASGPSSSQGGGKVISDGDNQSSSSGSAPEQPSQAQTDELLADPSEKLLSIAADFAVNFPWAFSSPDELNVTRFCLWKIYYEDPTATDQDGILWVSPEQLTEEVERRFDISDYQFQSPEQENVYPRYVEEKGAIAFMPVGEGSHYAVELVGQEAQGEYYDYIFDIYDNFITDGHEEMTLETTLRCRFRVVEGDDGAPFLQAVSATELPQEATTSQSGEDTVIETIPQEEQLSYFRKYIEPYYIVGLMYSTWSSPEEIEMLRLLRFFIYNESDNYYKAVGEDPSETNGVVPADIVEGYITSYFEVDPSYLRTTDYYDAATNSYHGMWTEGIGGGSGVTIDRIEKDRDIWKFICRDESGNQPSVTIRVFDENRFCYIAGEGPNL